MKRDTNELKRRLRGIGLTDSVIDAAWPAWWSDEAEFSVSARADLRFSLARKLGLDPRSLLEDDGVPRFVWRDEARFKHLTTESGLEQAAITSFGTAVGHLLMNATDSSIGITGLDPLDVRKSILNRQQFVRLLDLLGLCWSLEIPVIHLRVFPLLQKRMAAMSVRVSNGNAILLSKDSVYPASVAFYLAHELGHIAAGHLTEDTVLVDFEYAELASEMDDSEEAEADTFALKLLTGNPRPTILPRFGTYNARELAKTALSASIDLGIEPGTLALCFGYSTGDWATANAAMERIYSAPKDVWNEVNNVALHQLHLDRIPDDSQTYLKALLGIQDLL